MVPVTNLTSSSWSSSKIIQVQHLAVRSLALVKQKLMAAVLQRQSVYGGYLLAFS
jgi:hypothetical protein